MKLNQTDLLQAEVRRLSAERTSYLRLIEHQRAVLALALKRLGGTMAIMPEALARAASTLDIEIGERRPLTDLPESPAEAPKPPAAGPMVFRVINRETQEPVEKRKLDLPQVVRDLLDAVLAGSPDARHQAQRIQELLRKDEEPSA